MHYLIKKAYKELYPNKELDIKPKLKFSKAFKGYNANVKYSKSHMEFRLSYLWRSVSDEIKIGLLQTLFNKIYNTDIKTINIDLYNIFLKKIPTVTPKTKSDPILEDSFNRINNEYFNGLMLMPNLEFGGKNFHTMGTYDYASDTIRISQLLKKDLHLLDYVMYHEMLHKKFQYKKAGKKTMHHTTEFKKWEKRFKDKNIENKLKNFLKKKKIKDKLWFI